MDAVARDDLGKAAIDKDVVEKVSRVYTNPTMVITPPNELLYTLFALT